MIDLNRKKFKKTEKDTPIGAQILILMPMFTALFWAMLRGL